MTISISPITCWCSDPECRVSGCKAQKTAQIANPSYGHFNPDHEKRIEKAARAIAANKRGVSPLSTEVDRVWHSYVGQARTAVAAYQEPFSYMGTIPASGMSAFGQDAEERLEAKPASPTAEGGDARKDHP